MLSGYGGRLVAEAFLEARIASRETPQQLDRVQRILAAWKTDAALGPASSVRALLERGAAPLAAALGFELPAAVEEAGPLLAAGLPAAGGSVALLVAPWDERLDPLWRHAVVAAGRRGAAWCLLFNGTHVRIVDARRLHARRHLEFELELTAADPRTCAALWQTCAASALTAGPESASSLQALIAESDRHAAGVCRSLRDGVLAASRDVLAALVGTRPAARLPPVSDTFEQALTIVYRLLFLLFAEARALVPTWHPIYRESYSVDALREASERAETTPGLWDALRAIARLAHAGCRAGDLRVTPFNGRLFSPAHTPLADRRDLDDEAARRAVLALSTRAAADGAGRERIAYRDLGVEQLGAVYETLLDYSPRIEPAPVRGRRPAPRVTLEPGSGVRKATGTFYTPQPVAEYVVRRALGPLVRDAPPGRILALRVVDPAMGSGAFLVAACRYLASAYEAALVRAGQRATGDLDPVERTAIRRTIAERCLYGVDLNPMAVQLARLSLWLATLAADKPLGFLDHRLQAGDSLLGAWLSALKSAPRPRRRSPGAPSVLPLFEGDAARDALKEALPIRFALESVPDDTLDQVRAKERAFASMMAPAAALSRWKRVADLWCAAWLSDEVPDRAFAALSDAVLTGQCGLPARDRDRWLDCADAMARARRLFHWELEFPEVFFDADGARLANAGFDAVIGNPPWDMIRADAGDAGDRSRARGEIASFMRFTRNSGLCAAPSAGHANRYQLFLERAIALARRGGRLGLVLPSGLATDAGSSGLRRHLLSACDVDALVGLDNRRGVFPIHRSVRFLLVTASKGEPTRTIRCRLGLDDPAALESIGDGIDPSDADRGFPLRLTPDLIERISGPDLTIPAVATVGDLTIVEHAAALFPPLGSAAGWSARFGRELNATDDRAAFRPPGRGLPIVEGKHLEPFRAAVSASRQTIAASDARRLLGSDRHDRQRLAYRDVAAATNRLTLIAAVLPAGCVSTHTVFCLRTPLALSAQHCLCGLFNSLVVNYLVRLRVTTHVTTATVERLPIPPIEIAPAACREIARLARLLARRADFPSCARLNAIVAGLYQLTAEQFEHIVGTFPLIAVEERREILRVFATEKWRRP